MMMLFVVGVVAIAMLVGLWLALSLGIMEELDDDAE